MAVGQGSNMGHGSYLAFAREISYGTYVTATAGLNFRSCSLKNQKEWKVIEEIQTSRTNSNFVGLGRKVGGDVEFIFSPKQPACNWLLQNAMGGGPVTSVTSTGDTVGSAAFTHQIDTRNFDLTYSSLSVNQRKGETSTGKIFEYCGLRVDSLEFKADLDEPLIAVASLIGKDSSVSSNDISAQNGMTTTTQTPLSFVNGRFSAELTTGSLTSASFWHVQSVSWKVNNNLLADKNSRRIGSDVIGVLPAGTQTYELSVSLRFDTTTAYDAMMSGTRFAAEFEFQGDTLPGSKIREGLKVTMPYVLISDAGDPAINSAGDVVLHTVKFLVLRDPTSTGYACRAFVTNAASNYA